ELPLLEHSDRRGSDWHVRAQSLGRLHTIGPQPHHHSWLRGRVLFSVADAEDISHLHRLRDLERRWYRAHLSDRLCCFRANTRSACNRGNGTHHRGRGGHKPLFADNATTLSRCPATTRSEAQARASAQPPSSRVRTRR